MEQSIEVNVPFDGDVEYLINNEVVQIKQGTYHPVFEPVRATPAPARQLPPDGRYLRLPMHLFLSRRWIAILSNHVTGWWLKYWRPNGLALLKVLRWRQR